MYCNMYEYYLVCVCVCVYIYIYKDLAYVIIKTNES